MVGVAHLLLLEDVLNVDCFRVQTSVLVVHFVELFFLFFEFFPHFVVELWDDLKHHVVHVGDRHRVVPLLVVNLVIREPEGHELFFRLITDVY